MHNIIFPDERSLEVLHAFPVSTARRFLTKSPVSTLIIVRRAYVYYMHMHACDICMAMQVVDAEYIMQAVCTHATIIYA